MHVETRFEIIILMLFLIIIISEYVAYASFHTAGIINSKKFEIALMSLGIIIPLTFLISMIINYKHYTIFNSIANTISSVWLSFVFFIFVSSLIVFVLIIVGHCCDKNMPIRIISSILVAISIIVTTYGIWNSSNTRKTIYNISSEELSSNWEGKKIILISDLHIGSIHEENFIKKIVTMVNIEKPDFVFIAGDMIEGTSFPYKEWLGEFEKINPQTKIFYVEGNHEKYNLEYELFKSGIPNNINNITDKKIILDGIQLIGLHHEEEEHPENVIRRLNNLGYEKEKPSIILIHDPRNIKALSENNTSLILSGHTHNGQFYPFKWIVKYIYKNFTYGIQKINKTNYIVSSGIGTSMIPIRLGTKPEMVIVNIK